MDVKESQVIIALAFGQGVNKTPGKSNEALAKIVEKLCEKERPPLCLQWEVADCLPGLVKSHDLVVRRHREKDKYLDTYEVLAQAKAYCDRLGIERAIIVAHPDHAPRCAAVAAKLGLGVQIADTAGVPYDPDSVQEWTRNRDFFINEYESKAMEYYRRLGYID